MAREIEERRDFLETMTEAGHGQQYEPVIKAQIAEKVQELEAIDARIEAAASPSETQAPE